MCMPFDQALFHFDQSLGVQDLAAAMGLNLHSHHSDKLRLEVTGKTS